MPSKLSTTTTNKISFITNPVNSILITEFHKYMEISGASERHQNNSLKMVVAFAFFYRKRCYFLRYKKQRASLFIFGYQN